MTNYEAEWEAGWEVRLLNVRLNMKLTVMANYETEWEAAEWEVAEWEAAECMAEWWLNGG